MKKYIILVALYSLNLCAMEEYKRINEPASHNNSTSRMQSQRSCLSANRPAIAMTCVLFSLIAASFYYNAINSCSGPCADVDLTCKSCSVTQTNVCYSGNSLDKTQEILDQQNCTYTITRKKSDMCYKGNTPMFEGCPTGMFDKAFESQTKRQVKRERTQSHADSKQMMKQILKQTKYQSNHSSKATKYKSKGR